MATSFLNVGDILNTMLNNLSPGNLLANFDPSIIFGILAQMDPQTLKITFGAIFAIILLFLFALARRHIIETSLHGFWAGIFVGMITILLVEGSIIYFSKKYIFGERSASLPQNVKQVLTEGSNNVTKVLGVQTISTQSPQEILNEYNNLKVSEAQLIKKHICQE